MTSGEGPATRVPVLERAASRSASRACSPTTKSTSTLHRGEVHCLLGENGAGKTTLMNVIFGLYQPDAGEIRLDGTPTQFGSSSDAIAAGIGMVHQHFQLIPVFTVAENVVLGDELRRGPVLDLDTARERIAALGEQYGLVVDPDATIEDLSVGEQQRVELLKALFRNADILILDEPTAVLTPGEVDEFFGVVRSLVDQGKSIVFITHKLREVLEVADRITVLRHGRVVGTADPKAATQQSLATLMVGRDVIFEIEKGPAHPGAPMLQVRDLSVADDRGLVDRHRTSNFSVRAGEIFGIAGVEGNGQRELVEAIAGMRHRRRGPHRDRRHGPHRHDARARCTSTASATCPRTGTSTASSTRSRSPTTSCSTPTTGSRSRVAASASSATSTSRRPSSCAVTTSARRGSTPRCRTSRAATSRR